MIEALHKAVLYEFRKKLDQITLEEIQAAKLRVHERIQDEVASIGLKLDHMVRVDLHQDNIVITLQKKFNSEAKT